MTDSWIHQTERYRYATRVAWGRGVGERLKGDVRHPESCFGREVHQMDTALFRRVAEAAGLRPFSQSTR